MIFALIMGAVAAYAQQGSGDYYEGLSRKIGFSQGSELRSSGKVLFRPERHQVDERHCYHFG